jgi:hypothetical protein
MLGGIIRREYRDSGIRLRVIKDWLSSDGIARFAGPVLLYPTQRTWNNGSTQTMEV